MKLTFVIVHFNQAKYLSKCINSLNKFIKKYNEYEIVIVDNSSLFLNSKEIKGCTEKLLLIKNKTNSGFAAGNNIGFKNSSGDIFIFINPDIEFRVDISNAIKYIEENKDIGVVGIRLLNYDGTWQRSYGNFPTLWRKFCDAFLLSKVFKSFKFFKGVHEYNEFKEPKEVEWVTGAFMIVRREAFQQVKGFDEDFFLYLEDIDLCKRIRDKGWKVVYYPYTEAIHYLGGESKLSKDFVIDHGDSPYIYFKKHHGRWSLPILWIMTLTETFFKSFLFESISLFNERYKKSFRMCWNTFKFSLLKSPLIIYKLINP